MAEKVKVRVTETKEQAESVAEAVRDSLAEKVLENPYGMLAAAFAVGYVAAGGLFTKTTARMVDRPICEFLLPFFIRGKPPRGLLGGREGNASEIV